MQVQCGTGQGLRRHFRPRPATSDPCGRPSGCSQTRSRPRRLRAAAVLEQEPPAAQRDGAGAPRQQQLQREQLERLLPPSLASGAGTVQRAELDAGAAAPRRLAPTFPDQVFYFGYGANLHLTTLKRRAVVPLSRSPAFVLDRSVRLVFQHRGGYSSLRQLQPGQAPRYAPYMDHVHGCVYQLRQEDLKALAKREGGYQLVDIEVETYDGWRVTAKTFVSGPLAALQAEVTPTEAYMKKLRDGAADNYLDPLYQAWLSSIPTVPSVGLPQEYYDTPAKFIAYGFLGIVALLVVGFFAQP